MSKPQFTSSQIKAINEELDNPAKNVLISAAAGCGKTFVMVNRIISKLLNEKVNNEPITTSTPLNLNEMIIVTFTDAAASELKEKLDNELNKQLKMCTDLQKQALIKKQIDYLSDAYISTFHALYLRLLKENKAEFKFARPITIIDDLLSAHLNYRCYKQIEQTYFNEQDFIILKKQFDGLTTSEQLYNIFNITLEYCLANGGIDKFIKQETSNEVNDLLAYPVFGPIISQTTNDALLEMNKTLINIKNLLPEFEEAADIRIEQLNKFKEKFNISYEENYRLVHIEANETKIFTKISKKIYSKFGDSVIEQYDIFHKELRESLDKLKNKVYAFTETDYLAIVNNSNYYLKVLLKYVKEYYLLINSEKKRLGLLSFDDLELEMLALLYDQDGYTNLADKLQKQFKEVMIDEYQDTSFNQELIVQALTNQTRTFMVGDVKQSIYKFRKATPQIFVSKKDNYVLADNDHLLIELSHNFRSNKYVLDTTNFVFKNVFSQDFGQIIYDENQQLNCGKMINIFDQIFALQPELSCDIREQSTDKMLDYLADDGKFTTATKQLIAQEMNQITGKKTKLFINRYEVSKEIKAPKIAELYHQTSLAIIKQIQVLKAQGVNYKDITILIRNRSNSNILTNLLQAYQIPYMLHLKKGFFDSYPIKDLLNLLKALVDNQDEVSFYASLHSYFFNLSNDDIYQLSLIPETTLYHKLAKSQHQEVFNIYKRLKQLANQADPLQLINEIYKVTPYLNLYTKNEDVEAYEQLMMNLNLFKQLIYNNLAYYRTLNDFMIDLERGFKDKLDSANPALISSKSDVVNIMTIHRSKGLEFDYVFIIDETEIKPISNHGIQLHQNQLFLNHYLDENQAVKITNPLNYLKKTAQIKEEKEEIARLFYVALTRAKKQLFIFRNISSKEYRKMVNNLLFETKTPFSAHLLTNAKKMSDSLIYSVLKVAENHDIMKVILPFLEVEPYDLELIQPNNTNLLSSKKIVLKSYVNKKVNDSKIKIKPSQHQVAQLDFTKISKFNTYQQGSNVHKVLELLNFKSETLIKDLDNLAKKFNLTANNKAGILAFINSDMFEIIKNNTYYKEYSFILNEDNQSVGIIDLYVESAEYIYIIDYKSDHLTEEELKDNYSAQLQYYESIIKQSTKKPIKLAIYSLVNKGWIYI